MKTYYADWYIKYRKEQHEKPAHERVKGWLKRKEIWGLRMALVKAASEGVPFIRVEDFEWAIAYLDKMQAPFEECMASLGTIGKFDGRDVVMQHIKRAGGNATMRQLYKHRAIRSAFKTHEDLAKALETLVYSEELRKLISLNTASDHRYALARIGEETEDDE